MLNRLAKSFWQIDLRYFEYLNGNKIQLCRETVYKTRRNGSLIRYVSWILWSKTIFSVPDLRVSS